MPTCTLEARPGELIIKPPVEKAEVLEALGRILHAEITSDTVKTHVKSELHSLPAQDCRRFGAGILLTHGYTVEQPRRDVAESLWHNPSVL